MPRRRSRIVNLPPRRIKGRLVKLKSAAAGIVARKAAAHLARSMSLSREPPPPQYHPRSRIAAADREAEALDERRHLVELYARLRRSHGSL